MISEKIAAMSDEQYAKLREEVFRAFVNIVKGSKKSLLDYVDYLQDQRGDVRTRVFTEYMKRRIHSDISLIQHQVFAVFQIYENGGVIPPFGRTPEELAARRGKGDVEASKNVNRDGQEWCDACGGSAVVEDSGVMLSCPECNGLGIRRVIVVRKVEVQESPVTPEDIDRRRNDVAQTFGLRSIPEVA